MADSIAESMGIVYEWLSDKEVEETQKVLSGLPEAIADDSLLAISLCKLGGITTGLLIVTTGRIVFINTPWMAKSARQSFKSKWEEVASIEYSDGKLTINKNKGLVRKQYFIIQSKSHTCRLLNTMSKFAPLLEEDAVVDAETEKTKGGISDKETDSTEAQVRDVEVVKPEKESAIDKAIDRLSIVDTRCLAKGEIKELPAILWEDELPRAIVSGRYHNGYGVLVATDRRLIFIDKGLVGLTIEDFYFEDISSIETHEGWLVGHIRIYARGNREIIEDIRKDLVRSLADWIRNQLATNKNLNQADGEKTSTQSSVSIADELSKFAELHKNGILTDEEFSEQKSKLLGSL